MYFASPVTWSTQGICSPFPLPWFTPFLVTSTRQQFLSLACRKNKLVFRLDKYPTTAPRFLNATINMLYSFPGSNWALRNLFLDKCFFFTSSCKRSKLWYAISDHTPSVGKSISIKILMSLMFRHFPCLHHLRWKKFSNICFKIFFNVVNFNIEISSFACCSFWKTAVYR